MKPCTVTYYCYILKQNAVHGVADTYLRRKPEPQLDDESKQQSGYTRRLKKKSGTNYYILVILLYLVNNCIKESLWKKFKPPVAIVKKVCI